MRVRLPSIALLAVLLASPALAWNKPTHQVIGAIAYDVLKQDSPETIARVVELLKKHPEWDTFAKRLETVPAEDRDRYLFMQAARWADDVREGQLRKYHHGEWHYANNPIVRIGEAAKVTPPTTPGHPNIISALETNALRMSGWAGDIVQIDAERAQIPEPVSDSDKAIAACWVMHLVGDLHQPLHAVSFFGLD